MTKEPQTITFVNGTVMTVVDCVGPKIEVGSFFMDEADIDLSEEQFDNSPAMPLNNAYQSDSLKASE